MPYLAFVSTNAVLVRKFDKSQMNIKKRLSFQNQLINIDQKIEI